MTDIGRPELAVDAARAFSAARHPVVLFCNGLGDHLLTLPALRALCSQTQGQFTLVCKKGMPAWFFSGLHIDRIIETRLTPHPSSGYTFDARDVAAHVGHCDFLIDLNTWCSEATMQLVEELGHPPVLGTSNRAYTWCLVEALSCHFARVTFNIVRCLNPDLELENFSQPPIFDCGFARRAQRIRELCPGDRPFLAIHTETLPLKEWPIDYWRELLDAFLDRHPEWLVWVLDALPRGLRCGRHEQQIIPLAGYSVPTSCLVLAHARLFIGIDSVFLHAADSYGVPGIGLFGPTDPDVWGFLGGQALHHRVMPMSSLLPSVVLASAEALLEKTPEVTVLPRHSVRQLARS